MKKSNIAKISIAGLLLTLLLVLAVACNGVAGSSKVIDPSLFIRTQSTLVLRADDLALNYNSAPGSEARFSNDEVQYQRGQVEGKNYIVATGRVDGYMLELERSKSTDIAPYAYASYVEAFETTEGASLAFSPEWFEMAVDGKWELDENADSDCKIGNECRLISYTEFQPTTNLTNERYDVIFRYQNVLVFVSTRSLDIEVSAQNALDAAQILYDKLVEVETVSP